VTVPIPSYVPPDANERPRDRARGLVLMAATVAGVYVCYRLVLPFVPAFAWALAFAVLFAPVHRWNEARLKRPNLAAGISVTMVATIVVVPGLLAAGRLVDEAARGTMAIRKAIDSGQWQQALEAHPRIAPLVNWIEQQLDLPALIGNAAAWLMNTSASLVRGSIAQTIAFVLTFYFLAGRATDAIHATFYGTIVCSGKGADLERVGQRGGGRHR